jgi:hypothetical protein
MDLARALRAQRREVLARRVTLVAREAVPRVALVERRISASRAVFARIEAAEIAFTSASPLTIARQRNDTSMV